jgi:hypothetical protein
MTQRERRLIARHEGKCIECRRRKAVRDRLRCRTCLKAQKERAQEARAARKAESSPRARGNGAQADGRANLAVDSATPASVSSGAGVSIGKDDQL